MCTFPRDRTVVVCDVAIGHVRRALDSAFAGRIRYSHLEHEGTLVQAAPDVPAEQFTARAEAAIQAAQDASDS